MPRSSNSRHPGNVGPIFHGLARTWEILGLQSIPITTPSPESLMIWEAYHKGGNQLLGVPGITM